MSADSQSLSGPFSLRAIVIVIAVALIAAVGFVLLSAYSENFRTKRNGGAHALSTSAVGFLGTTELIRMTRGNVGFVRRKDDLYTSDLLILTPGEVGEAASLKRIVDQRSEESLPTLIILPKWSTSTLLTNRAWVNTRGELPPFVAASWLREIAEVTLDASPPGGLRTIKGARLHPVVESPDGGALVASVDDSSTYILADPDVLNNMGLATRAGAERAVALLDQLAPEGQGISFDGSIAGFADKPNLLKLAVEEPFLPLTLCIVFAALLAGWHALVRFGPTAHIERKVAFGKRAIIENGAALLRLAGRRHRTGERYAALTRDAVAAATGAPHALSGEALDRYLDRLNREGEPFTSLAERATAATDTRQLLAAVRDLHHWKRTVTREH